MTGFSRKILACLFFVAPAAPTGSALAQGDSRAATFDTFYSFPDTKSVNPGGGLYRDSKGALFGTTLAGGPTSEDCPSGCGTIFKLTPPSPGNP
jgi:uncharacterized repeat protein (TIGR03803 family)